MQLTIGELAKATGVSARSIRHYHNNDLLAAVRACNGYRYFDMQAITQVRQIQRLIATGFSVAEIRRFPDCMLLIGGATFCPETQAIQYQRLKEIEDQISELEQRKARLLETLRQNGHSDAVTLHK
ncbi:MerR family transcriptional regulator [Cronobacter sakazakii]|uniref:MerR family transcriptional regulator n=1 Tax=Cronobacter sakazakii TaxID=28141 RepID=UPI000CFBBE15|nr:MerR family transcriptional regulator [Cronobacter sakazakii]EKK3974861.1 MerR family transcriptional regulator [Cronobacter sakazakii]EKY1980254.1 MerR family transcriptional regulator [Cronobacter sakazakii]EKY1997212.1 MerR family transcriptional regulator [Cronobacter sakazakii]ELY3755314.1 MerR family transcriptional regulator [Cronobacter sakazakii]ELY5987346.1 MerR family transcriptional regulator [Cronobacter sakazakii]